MAVKKPGQFIYWQDKHFHIVGEVVRKDVGYYKIGREVAVRTGSDPTVLFHTVSKENVYKTEDRKIPDWFFHEVIETIFLSRNLRRIV